MTECNLTQSAKTTTYVFDYEVKDAPDRPVPYRKSTSDAMYRPDRAWLKFTQLGDGPVRLSDDRVYGRKLKQDGTVGAVQTHEQWWSGDRPDWLTDLIDNLKLGLSL
jgi:hypothetical protein